MNAKLFIIFLLLTLLIIVTGCITIVESPKTTDQVKPPQPTNLDNCPDEFPVEKSSSGEITKISVTEWAEFEQCGKDIPSKYKNVKYCEVDSDCVHQETGCGSFTINRYNKIEDYVQKVGDATGYYPHCYTQGIPDKFLTPYCENNECKLKTDCSNCGEINDFLESIGCFQDGPHLTVQRTCDELAKCGC
ncbi:MAG TPA: hypothetical protein VJG49_03530 [Candidatus Nanoarchaeia archaeon]|nr:hypothetical protein [Candidatus Nanoarchaeia archaeon]